MVVEGEGRWGGEAVSRWLSLNYELTHVNRNLS